MSKYLSHIASVTDTLMQINTRLSRKRAEELAADVVDQATGGKLRRDFRMSLVKGLRDHGLTQQDLVDRSGVAQPTMHHLLTGYRKGSIETWTKLLTALEAE